MSHKKKINLNLVGLDSNAFSLLGAFRKQAKREGWTPEEIDYVLTKAKSGDYANLTSTLADHCDPLDDKQDEECTECDRDSDE